MDRAHTLRRAFLASLAHNRSHFADDYENDSGSDEEQEPLPASPRGAYLSRPAASCSVCTTKFSSQAPPCVVLPCHHAFCAECGENMNESLAEGMMRTNDPASLRAALLSKSFSSLLIDCPMCPSAASLGNFSFAHQARIGEILVRLGEFHLAVAGIEGGARIHDRKKCPRCQFPCSKQLKPPVVAGLEGGTENCHHIVCPGCNSNLCYACMGSYPCMQGCPHQDLSVKCHTFGDSYVVILEGLDSSRYSIMKIVHADSDDGTTTTTSTSTSTSTAPATATATTATTAATTVRRMYATHRPHEDLPLPADTRGTGADGRSDYRHLRAARQHAKYADVDRGVEDGNTMTVTVTVNKGIVVSIRDARGVELPFRQQLPFAEHRLVDEQGTETVLRNLTSGEEGRLWPFNARVEDLDVPPLAEMATPMDTDFGAGMQPAQLSWPPRPFAPPGQQPDHAPGGMFRPYDGAYAPGMPYPGLFFPPYRGAHPPGMPPPGHAFNAFPGLGPAHPIMHGPGPAHPIVPDGPGPAHPIVHGPGAFFAGAYPPQQRHAHYVPPHGFFGLGGFAPYGGSGDRHAAYQAPGPYTTPQRQLQRQPAEAANHGTGVSRPSQSRPGGRWVRVHTVAGKAVSVVTSDFLASEGRRESRGCVSGASALFPRWAIPDNTADQPVAAPAAPPPAPAPRPRIVERRTRRSGASQLKNLAAVVAQRPEVQRGSSS